MVWKFLTSLPLYLPLFSSAECVSPYLWLSWDMGAIHCNILFWFINTSVPSIFWQIDTIALVMSVSNFSWSLSCISCIKSLINTLPSFTLKLLVSRISSLMLIHLFLMINPSNSSWSIEIVNGSSILWCIFEITLRILEPYCFIVPYY